MPSRRAPSPSLAVSVCVCVALNAVPVLLGLWGALPSPDAEVHKFFADHYQHRWLDPWEPRWYAGFFVYSYPPLAHQAIAALAWLVGIDGAYALVTLAAAAALPIAIWHLTAEVAGPEAASKATLLAAVVPGVWETLYLWGQLPNVVSLVLAIAASAYAMAYVRRGGLWNLAASALLGGASVAAHQLTGLIGLPMLALASIVSAVTGGDGDPTGTRVRRASLALLCGVVAAAPTVAPFLWWFENARVAQAPVGHPSRGPFFLNPDDGFEYWLGMWSLSLIGAALSLRQAARSPSLWPFVAVATIWGVLSLGPTFTPLPHMLFGELASWLTYERFGLWATVLLLVPTGAALTDPGARRALGLLFTVSLLSAALLTGLNRLRSAPPCDPAAPSTVEAARFLSAEGRDQWNYLTLGLGLPRAFRFSRLTHAACVDGGYLTARRDLLLSRSGASVLDGAADGGAGALGFVRVLLRTAQAHQLRWVVSGSPEADRVVSALGWTRRATWGASTADAPDRLTLFEAPTASLGPGGIEPAPPSPASLRWLWGLAPLGLLSGGLCAAALARRDEMAGTA